MTHYYSKAVDVQPVIADITLYPDHAALVDAIFDEYCNRTNEPFEYAIRIDESVFALLGSRKSLGLLRPTAFVRLRGSDEQSVESFLLKEYKLDISDCDGLSRNADAYKQADVKHKLDVALTYCLSPQAMELKEGYFDDDRKEDLR